MNEKARLRAALSDYVDSEPATAPPSPTVAAAMNLWHALGDDEVWVVITTHDGTVTDTEVLAGRPQWTEADLPIGYTQTWRCGHVNGGDTSVERILVGQSLDA